MDEKSKKLFLGLYQMILADTEVHPKELEGFYQIGKERGVTAEEIQQALFSSNNLISSENLSDDERIEYLYNLARIAWADDKLDEKEKEILQNACRRLEFAEENVEEIVTFLLEQARDNKAFDDVLAIIKNS
ncbi:MAG: TerB family tellurite resistance protein [Dysgonamonadaceae bacterium]|jgi:uncharacterized tellurite resistance protein B-like protein|nr:TerB family tellurite resistance protein [Dysgonamonadaceae bacterium]